MTFPSFLHAHLVALYILLAALGLGGGALRLLRLPSRGMERLWLAWVGGLGLLSVSTLLLGMLGMLYTWLFAALLLPCALGGLWLLAHSGVVRAARDWLAWNQAGWFRVLAYLLILLSAGSVLWIWLTHALMPPYEWDELIYHLTVPKLFNQAHATIFIPWNCFSLWPLNNEMLFGIALLLGSDVAPHLITLCMAMLTLGGLLLVARQHFDDRVGIVAVALFLSVPLVKRLAGTALIDIALGMYVLAAFAMYLRWQQERCWQWLVLCGVMCGFTAGSKLSGAAFLGLFGLLVLLDGVRQRPLHVQKIVANCLLFSMAGVLVVSAWYIRSFVYTGNPVWPFAYSLFGGKDWDALGNEYLTQAQLDVISPNFARTPYWLLQSFIYMITQPFELGRFAGGFGVVIPVGTLAASLLMLRSPRALGQMLLVCGVFYLLWFAFLPLQIRYLMPVLPLMVLATAYLFVWMYQNVRFPFFRIVLALVLIIILTYNWPWIVAEDRELLASHMPVLRGEISADEWIDKVHKGHKLIRYANENLPNNARILLIPYEVRTFYLDKDYVWGSLTTQRIIPFEQFSTADELAVWLRELGITHVIDNPAIKYDRLRYWQHDRELMLALRDQCGHIIYGQDDAVLYELRSCEVGTMK
jgi:hypothetical protein